MLILISLIILVLAKDFIAKQAIEKIVKEKTGLNLRLDEIKISLLNTDAHLRNIYVDNPWGFSEKKMIKIPELFIDINILALLKNKIHIKDLKVHLEKVLVEKKQNGALNIKSIELSGSDKANTLKGARSSQYASFSENTTSTSSNSSIKLQVDRLHLIIERIEYIEMTPEGEKKRVLNLNLDKKFKNITSLDQLKNIITSHIGTTVILNTIEDAIQSLDLEDIKGKIGKGEDDFKEQLDKLEDAAKDILKGFPF